MNEEPDNRELEKQIAVLEERMNTHEARIDSTLHALRADQNAMRADQNAMRTDIERINTDAAKRSDTQTKWIIGVGIALAALIIGGVGILIAMQ